MGTSIVSYSSERSLLCLMLPHNPPPHLQGIPAGLEMELCTMIIECCSQEKTFIK